MTIDFTAHVFENLPRKFLNDGNPLHTLLDNGVGFDPNLTPTATVNCV
jgi:hypothetical protein